MILTPAQSVIAKDLHRFRVLCCGRRFGKTTLAIDQIKGCAAYRTSRVCYIAPTFQQARDIAWEQLKRDCKDAAISINESRLEIRLANVEGKESLIVLRGWEAVETLRGQQFDLVVIDEVASMRDFWMQWQEVVRPTLTDTRGEALFISTPKGFNHFYELYNMEYGIGDKAPDSDFKSFHYTSFDNPHLPIDEIEKARAELGPYRFDQEYMAMFSKLEGLVYKEFDRGKHLLTPEAMEKRMGENYVYRELMVGIDFGYTAPCAVLSIYRDAQDALYVLHEWYERGKTDVEVAEYVAALKANRVYPDPEAPAAIKELRNRGVNVRTVIKGKDSIKNGIDDVRELFRAGKLFISTECRNLIQELEMYSYPDKKPGHNEDELPIDENNHALDALRYVVSMAGSAVSNRPTTFVPSGLARGKGQLSAMRGVSTRKRFPQPYTRRMPRV